MNILKLLTIVLLLATANIASAQSFTNVVNEEVTIHKVFNYNYNDGPGNVDIEQPLAFFAIIEGNSINIRGTLSHIGINYLLFNNVPASTSTMIVSPIDSFFGKSQGGNWSFSLQTKHSIILNSWGVVPASIIPEPSVFSLAIVGGMLILSVRSKKEHRL